MLPEKEYKCGLSEMVKIAAISDGNLFEHMEEQGLSLYLYDAPGFRRLEKLLDNLRLPTRVKMDPIAL